MDGGDERVKQELSICCPTNGRMDNDHLTPLALSNPCCVQFYVQGNQDGVVSISDVTGTLFDRTGAIRQIDSIKLVPIKY